ncbi:MAG TPA: cupredoxin domain-containing protein [Caulobacteraceae bacterium]|jgi:plastocyanin|nr:cupredoxin domain-containing protein [Caulobacteraceae bacterium]
MNCTKALRQLAVVALIGSGALASCSAPSRPASKTYVVTMANMDFSAKTLSAHVGDTIQWVNKDMFRHSATAKDGSFDIDIDVGQSGSTKLTKPGNVQVTCKYHPTMTQQILVNP